jgi:HD-GYP domain-containing protein (c-di-GMP phosphodiesterase class II)
MSPEEENEALKKELKETKAKLKKREEEYRQAQKKFKEIRSTVRRNYQGMVQLVIEIVSLDNRFLGGHLKRCSELAKAFGEHRQYPKDYVYLLYYSALLHDIGMVGKSPSLVSRPESELSGDELSSYRAHPIEGEEILRAIYNLKRTAAVVRSHHERWDGSGFPDRLTRTEAALGARIVGIINSWDNLLYKHGFSPEDALKQMKKGSERLFDPELLESFLGFVTEWMQNRSGEETNVSVDELEPGMVLQEDVLLSNGLLLVPHGMILDAQTVGKIRSFSKMLAGKKRFRVI